jgi:uncharacterized MAPEG superfamily protein
MSVEAQVLALAGLLAVVQLFLFAVPANLSLGSGYLAGPRDERRELTGRPARLQRAFNNHIEGLVLFTVAVVAVTLAGKASGFTAACAWAYLAARILFVPAYAYGWTPWRSAIWSVGFLATVAMLVAALL